MCEAAEDTPFELMGGEAAFRRITEIFYEEVAHEPLVLELYPEEDLEPAREGLEKYLVRYWSDPEGNEHLRPQLWRYHLRFTITSAGTEAWLACMRKGIDTALSEELMTPAGAEMLWDDFVGGARLMINSGE